MAGLRAQHSPYASPRRRTGGGFTVLELLASLMVILVLLSVLLPVIGGARQVARRAQCQNNLKQINLALALYHDLFETFPPGYVSRSVSPSDGADQETGPGFSWGCLLLDYLDQTPLAAAIDFDTDLTDPVNFGVAGMILPTWTCPADDPDPTIEVETGGGVVLLGASSYVGMSGFGSLTAQPGSPAGPGVLYRNSHVPIFGIRDGSSHTMLIGERVARYLVDDQSPPIEAGGAWFAAVPGVFRKEGLAHSGRLEGPASLILGTVGQQVPYPLELRPNHTTHICAFSSRHRGGFQAAMADTSVRFISDVIDFETLKRLAQHSDRQPLGDF